jgi:hypothetical protein
VTTRLYTCAACGLLIALRPDGTVRPHDRDHRGEPCGNVGRVVGLRAERGGAGA